MNILIILIILFASLNIFSNGPFIPDVCGLFFELDKCINNLNYSIYSGFILTLICVFSLLLPIKYNSNAIATFLDKILLKDLFIYLLFISLIFLSAIYSYFNNGYAFETSWLGSLFPTYINNSISIIFFNLVISDLALVIIQIIKKMKFYYGSS